MNKYHILLILCVIILVFILIKMYYSRKNYFDNTGDVLCKIKNGKLQTDDGRECATSSRYWDCSRNTCSWNPNSCGDPGTCANCSGSQDGIHNSKYMQMYMDNNENIYATAAASESFGITTSGGKTCGKCYELEMTGQCGNPNGNCNDANNVKVKNKKIIAMVTNVCPDWWSGYEVCPPTLNDYNSRHANHHFDIAIPGGGFGVQGKCDPNFSWNPKNLSDCSNTKIIPSEYQQSCEIYFNQLNAMDNPMVAFKEINCPNFPSYQKLNCK